MKHELHMHTMLQWFLPLPTFLRPRALQPSDLVCIVDDISSAVVCCFHCLMPLLKHKKQMVEPLAA